MAWDWQVGPRRSGFAASWGIGLERDLQASPVLHLALPDSTKVINPGPCWRKHHYMNAVVCYAPSPVFGTGCGDCGWTDGVGLQAAMQTTGRGGVISECCYCLYLASGS